MDKAEIDAKLAQVITEEDECIFPAFDHTTAWDFGHLVIEEAGKRGFNIAIRICLGDQIVFQYSMPGTKAGNEVWLERKIRTVYFFGDSTERTGLYHAQHGRDFYETPWIDPFLYTKHGGGFPIRVQNSSAVVGAIAMSNAHGHEHGFIVEMIRKFIAQ